MLAGQLSISDRRLELLQPKVFKDFDERTSAIVLSGCSIIVLLAVIAAVCVLDAPRLVKHYCRMVDNINTCFRRFPYTKSNQIDMTLIDASGSQGVEVPAEVLAEFSAEVPEQLECT